jgi:hypothetical protein
MFGKALNSRFLSIAVMIVLALAPVARADDGGIRQITSKHLTLFTDLPANDEVDALSGYFDQAFEQWCGYFGVDAAKHADWQVRGCLMRSSDRFAAAGLLPADLPSFANGYSLGAQLWIHEQNGVYYRRHLLVHEGTHCFMHTILGGIGPPWYAEGTAELLATHRVDDGKLLLKSFPRSAQDVSKWGRIEIVQTACADHRAKTLAKIFALGGTLHADAEPYAWSWGAAAFFDGHPRYRERFRLAQRHVAGADFNDRFQEAFAPDAARLNEDWQLFVANIDYGYDFGRMEVDLTPGAPLASKRAQVRVAADRGWQSSGIALERGEKYHLRATGQYVVAHDDKPWVCEPGGVTIQYHHGRPLGILLAAIRSDEPQPSGSSGLVKPIVAGLDTTLEVHESGTLYFRINDSAGRLGDNSGAASVEVVRE